MDLDKDRLGLLLVRVSELRFKVANCVARENSAAGEARSHEQLMSNGEDDSSNVAVEGDEESENLLAICEAFDSLECQLGSLQEIKHLWSYLMDLKKASAEEMRRSVYANYIAFIRMDKILERYERYCYAERQLTTNDSDTQVWIEVIFPKPANY